MLSIKSISKAFAGRTLFSDACLQINRRDRIGIVGRNGAGKSTLFSIILSETTPDSGVVALERGAKVGFLPQESAPAGEESVIELVCAVSEKFAKAAINLGALGQSNGGEPSDEDYEVFESAGGARLIAKARQILSGLSFKDSDFDRPARELSGGWIMRAHLARLLVMEPDLLMLDEPTNHLDLNSLIWLQGYLQNYSGAILLISHDREFLNQIVQYIVELEGGRVTRYTGNHEKYLVQREANEAQRLAAYENQQKEIERLMGFVERFRAKNTKATQAQSKLKQIERMEKIEAPFVSRKKMSFSFPQPVRSGQRVIALRGLAKSYGELQVYTSLNLEVERQQRIVLVGPNGAGKSTLLKILAGVLGHDAGERDLGHNVQPGYFAQHRAETLDLKRTVLEEMLDTRARVTEESARTLLGGFLFSEDDVFKKVGVLSGGEKSRLALAKLLLNPPNFLLLDEPTTHLDMGSIDTVIEAMSQFKGTLVFISHDVHFIRKIASRVIHVEQGQLRHYPGPYDYYLDKTGQQSSRATQTSLTNGVPVKGGSSPGREDAKARKRREAKQRQVLSKKRRAKQDAIDMLETKIATLEERQGEITSLLEQPETYANGGQAQQLNRELMQINDDHERFSDEWSVAVDEFNAIV
ncbi:MAG: ABC-F family ATP-binding cassette domain-containing protein [Verrucomicrobiota bacterium]|jgi:ATP-binding cassette subfamily F protein 3|nr:ABC-F family ATP-binding cassette domain-containing protein [Verrucomicrobiota bacterium]MDP7178575.1 ABC-F family ATP-binding cassette domain-containing protein [Verrucomicrobiota bacterium]MDP7290889.1 ABC-F family ATP-binding cassette domain-containing protein [Verrucomicrobiota bacterium]MDP7442235.1 ABC-F family ATP-binding cassette domain-containing protein [Verrucomicrobiota bacterium]HJN82164.1 ABC-F family ATP-binding cassette domain-containing protein [Verrucomicrobiota bacterium]